MERIQWSLRHSAILVFSLNTISNFSGSMYYTSLGGRCTVRDMNSTNHERSLPRFLAHGLRHIVRSHFERTGLSI